MGHCAARNQPSFDTIIIWVSNCTLVLDLLNILQHRTRRIMWLSLGRVGAHLLAARDSHGSMVTPLQNPWCVVKGVPYRADDILIVDTHFLYLAEFSLQHIQDMQQPIDCSTDSYLRQKLFSSLLYTSYLKKKNNLMLLGGHNMQLRLDLFGVTLYGALHSMRQTNCSLHWAKYINSRLTERHSHTLNAWAQPAPATWVQTAWVQPHCCRGLPSNHSASLLSGLAIQPYRHDLT